MEFMYSCAWVLPWSVVGIPRHMPLKKKKNLILPFFRMYQPEIASWEEEGLVSIPVLFLLGFCLVLTYVCFVCVCVFTDSKLLLLCLENSVSWELSTIPGFSFSAPLLCWLLGLEVKGFVKTSQFWMNAPSLSVFALVFMLINIHCKKFLWWAFPFTSKIRENEIFVKINGKLNQNFY